MKTLNTKTKLASALVLVLGLSACNLELSVDGETVAQINVTKTGVITQLDDTMVVNDTSYDTQSASVVADGVDTDSSALKEGMVVSVSGTESSDGSSFAQQITYENEVEGVVSDSLLDSNGVGTMTVLGQTVKLDEKTVFDSDDLNDRSVTDIETGNIVEVSGYADGDGSIYATRVEVKQQNYIDGNELELKGKVTNLTDSSFSIGDQSIDYSSASLNSDSSSTLKDGQYVKVSSYESLDDNGNLIAHELEIKRDGELSVSHKSDDDEVEIKGAVTAELNNGAFEINGAVIKLSANLSQQLMTSFGLGSIVEAEGYIDDNGQFIATEVKLENDSDSSSDSSFDDDDDDNESESDDDENDD